MDREVFVRVEREGQAARIWIMLGGIEDHLTSIRTNNINF